MFHDRRLFLKIGAYSGLYTTLRCLFPVSVVASMNRWLTPERRLSFYNTHTNERLVLCYYRQGRYSREALAKINYIFRDHYTGKIKPIQIDLLDLLHAVSKGIGDCPQFHIISGYRTPETNAMLRKKSKCVAKHSLHIQGKAVDIRVPGCHTKMLCNISMKLKAGGVGYYPKSDFVHVDTGDVRYW